MQNVRLLHRGGYSIRPWCPIAVEHLNIYPCNRVNNILSGGMKSAEEADFRFNSAAVV